MDPWIALSPVLLERRVLDALSGRLPTTRADWIAMGPEGLRVVYAIAVADAPPGADVRLRATALATLGQLGNAAWIDAMLSALADPSAAIAVRCGAIEGLGWLGSPRALPFLQAAALHPDFRVRLYTVGALSRIGGAGARRILADLGERDVHPQVRAAAWREWEGRPEGRELPTPPLFDGEIESMPGSSFDALPPVVS
jgi:hypothetical protein